MNFDAWKNMKSVYSARIYTREQMKKEKRIDWL